MGFVMVFWVLGLGRGHGFGVFRMVLLVLWVSNGFDGLKLFFFLSSHWF